MTKPIIESVAKALLINPKNEVLILSLGEHKQRPDKSYKPDLPGGIVDIGESEHQGVVREVAEETGLTIQQEGLAAVYSGTNFFDEENKSVSKHLFIGYLPQDAEVTLSWEHSDYKWVPVEDLRAVELGSFYNEAIQYCLVHKLIEG